MDLSMFSSIQLKLLTFSVGLAMMKRTLCVPTFLCKTALRRIKSAFQESYSVIINSISFSSISFTIRIPCKWKFSSRPLTLWLYFSFFVATVGPKVHNKRCANIERCGRNELNEEFVPLLTNFGPGNGQLTGICCNSSSGCNSKIFNGRCIIT